ncbi:hypothetical protein HHI36_012197 [Cryptolaemus montrouzieri]|uniref:Methyltransferase domain-containing protein n=1 Tax=Cryptolaemus montrouzieri TaxID=559131 RepID=A0ABD2NE63_9CUCU
MKILDIGSGPGHLLFEVESLFPKDYAEIIGGDKEIDMVKYLNSVAKNSRISSQLLDIEAENIPEHLKGRFDFAFSSFCFTYMTDLRKAFSNTRRMLKPNGDLFLIWCRRCHLYEIYKTLSETEKWAPYTREFKNWTDQFHNEDPIRALEKIVTEAGLTVVKAELVNDIIFKDDDPEILVDVIASVDSLSLRIPKADLDKYREDFNKIARSFIVMNENAENGLEATIPLPSLVVAAKRN